MGIQLLRCLRLGLVLVLQAKGSNRKDVVESLLEQLKSVGSWHLAVRMPVPISIASVVSTDTVRI